MLIHIFSLSYFYIIEKSKRLFHNFFSVVCEPVRATAYVTLKHVNDFHTTNALDSYLTLHCTVNIAV